MEGRVIKSFNRNNQKWRTVDHETTCPYCGYVNNKASTHMDVDAPTDGDVSIASNAVR